RVYFIVIFSIPFGRRIVVGCIFYFFLWKVYGNLFIQKAYFLQHLNWQNHFLAPWGQGFGINNSKHDLPGSRFNNKVLQMAKLIVCSFYIVPTYFAEASKVRRLFLYFSHLAASSESIIRPG